MKKYDNYKDSGIEWIGEIPSHWDVTRIKYKFQIGRGRVISNEDLVEDAIYPVYSSQTLNNGCLGYIETFDFDDKLITWTTDGANAGTVFLREGKFNCTNVCGTLKGKSEDIIPEFDYYFLQYATQFYKRPDTNGAKIMNNEMAVILSLKLSTEEQTAISKYLDHKSTQIDHLIAKKEQFIQLLEEERLAVINQAVTVGLDPTVPKKDSGIEWLGEIPEHWEVAKLKLFVDKITDGSHHSPPTEEQGKRYLSVKDIGNNEIKFDGCKLISENEFELLVRNGCQPIKGDVLLTKDGTIGRAAIVADDNDFVVLSSLGIIRPNHDKFDSNFLREWLVSDLNVNQMLSLIQGSALTRITITIIKNLIVVVPPIEEQLSIMEWLRMKVDGINDICLRVEKEIELLKEYKTALISEVVTGKVDVRNEKLN